MLIGIFIIGDVDEAARRMDSPHSNDGSRQGWFLVVVTTDNDQIFLRNMPKITQIKSEVNKMLLKNVNGRCNRPPRLEKFPWISAHFFSTHSCPRGATHTLNFSFKPESIWATISDLEYVSQSRQVWSMIIGISICLISFGRS